MSAALGARAVCESIAIHERVALMYLDIQASMEVYPAWAKTAKERDWEDDDVFVNYLIWHKVAMGQYVTADEYRYYLAHLECQAACLDLDAA